MRLDVFLKLSRLVSRRTVAQEFCDGGIVEVNGNVAKSSKEIKIGDVISIRRRNRLTTVSVEAISDKKQLSKDAGNSLYVIQADDAIPEPLT